MDVWSCADHKTIRGGTLWTIVAECRNENMAVIHFTHVKTHTDILCTHEGSNGREDKCQQPRQTIQMMTF